MLFRKSWRTYREERSLFFSLERTAIVSVFKIVGTNLMYRFTQEIRLHGVQSGDFGTYSDCDHISEELIHESSSSMSSAESNLGPPTKSYDGRNNCSTSADNTGFGCVRMLNR